MKFRAIRSPAFWVILLAILIATTSNLVNTEGMINRSASWAGDRPSLKTMASEISLIREGTIMADVKGRFRQAGDRYTFVEDGSNKVYKCLENLMLQRVVSAIKDDELRITWVVHAKTTEYSGENFLLLERAIKSR